MMLIILSDDICRLMQYVQMRLKVVFDDGIRGHHRWRGNYGGAFDRTAIKWSLYIPMTFYASFVQYISGGMSWISGLFLCKYF